MAVKMADVAIVDNQVSEEAVSITSNVIEGVSLDSKQAPDDGSQKLHELSVLFGEIPPQKSL